MKQKIEKKSILAEVGKIRKNINLMEGVTESFQMNRRILNGPFLFCIFKTVDKCSIEILPMTRSDPGTSGVTSNRSANCTKPLPKE